MLLLSPSVSVRRRGIQGFSPERVHFFAQFVHRDNHL